MISIERADSEDGICMCVRDRWGRRRPLIAFNVVAGVALILSLAVPKMAGQLLLYTS